MWNKVTLGAVVGSISVLSYIVCGLSNQIGDINFIMKYLHDNEETPTYWHAREIGSEIFKEYASKKFDILRTGLDQKSNEVLDFALNAMIAQAYLSRNKVAMFDLRFPTYHQNYLKQWVSEKKSLKDQYRIYNDFFTPEVFFFHHGLRFADKRILDYIKGKNIIDCGGFIGDSLLVLKGYTDKKVYTYEFAPKHIKEIENTARNNNISNYKLITKAISDKVSEMKVDLYDNVNGEQRLNNGEETTVNVTTIDTEAEKEKLKVGFIKMDIEGYALRAVKGAIKTIKRDRPVLSLAIYHNTDELFGVKPYLEANVENYVYEFQLQRFVERDIGEMILFAYPKEIMEN